MSTLATPAAHLEMTGNLGSIKPTSEAELEQAVLTVRDNATSFARLPIQRKIDLLRATLTGIVRVAPGWVAAACQAKGLDLNSSRAGEEWVGGPGITVRNLRLLSESLEAVARQGKPALGTGVARDAQGRLVIKVFPNTALDGAMFAGFTGHCVMLEGVTEEAARTQQAEFYARKDATGRVSVILGAGNVSSIPPLDTVYKMFVEGFTAILKMNPVNEYLGPFLTDAMAPLIQAGYLRIVYGGGDVGRFLVNHAQVDDVHITGSDVTHDLIVWGPPGPERERRKRDHDPLLKKSISSELGNVSPITVVPAAYSEAELWFQARNVASMVQNNGSFNCNAGKVVITAKGWPQRQRFLDLVRRCFGEMPLRKAYYPGARGRYDSLLGGRPRVEKFGTPGDDQLAWALCPDLDAADQAERLFQVEPFCGILSETALPTGDPAEFLALATPFCNDRLWGTLNATVIIPPALQRGSVGAALDQAIAGLRYGTVAVNHWPALCYGFVTPPWGGHPSATLSNIQSGLGWVHNTYLLGGVEKTVIRGPLTVSPRPPWFFDNQRFHEIGQKLLRMEEHPSWLKVPSVLASALRG